MEKPSSKIKELKHKNIFIQGAISPLFIAESIAKHNHKKNIGAHSIFLGQVRNDRINDQEVAAIEYSAYEEMALEKMNEIRESVFSSYELSCLHVHHSLGKVLAGEICLFVFTSSPHRKSAIDACEILVEKIKNELPIWGKEIFTSDDFVWKENK